MAYSYKTSNDVMLLANSSQILNLDFRSDTDFAIIRGQLQTLFGDPAYTDTNLENAYTYVIIMKNGQGAQFILSVYSGPSGPAIGGDGSINGIENAAQELKRYIAKATPSDYEYEGIYWDGPSKVVMGIKDGKPFYSEIEIDE